MDWQKSTMLFSVKNMQILKEKLKKNLRISVLGDIEKKNLSVKATAEVCAQLSCNHKKGYTSNLSQGRWSFR